MRAYPSNATSFEDYRPALPSPLPLPKELGELANLTYFNAAENKLQGWLSTRSERFRFRVDIINFFLQDNCLRSSENSSI